MRGRVFSDKTVASLPLASRAAGVKLLTLLAIVFFNLKNGNGDNNVHLVALLRELKT